MTYELPLRDNDTHSMIPSIYASLSSSFTLSYSPYEVFSLFSVKPQTNISIHTMLNTIILRMDQLVAGNIILSFFNLSSTLQVQFTHSKLICIPGDFEIYSIPSRGYLLWMEYKPIGKTSSQTIFNDENCHSVLTIYDPENKETKFLCISKYFHVRVVDSMDKFLPTVSFRIMKVHLHLIFVLVGERTLLQVDMTDFSCLELSVDRHITKYPRLYLVFKDFLCIPSAGGSIYFHKISNGEGFLTYFRDKSLWQPTYCEHMILKDPMGMERYVIQGNPKRADHVLYDPITKNLVELDVKTLQKWKDDSEEFLPMKIGPYVVDRPLEDQLKFVGVSDGSQYKVRMDNVLFKEYFKDYQIFVMLQYVCRDKSSTETHLVVIGAPRELKIKRTLATNVVFHWTN